MVSLVVSTIVYFVAAFYIRRYLEDMGVEKTMMRGFTVFVAAAAVAYGIAFVIDWAMPGQALTLF